MADDCIKKSFFLGVWRCLVLAALVFIVGPADAQMLLFKDNFSSATFETDINAGVADPGRQSGTLGTITYSQSNWDDYLYIGGELQQENGYPLSLNTQCISMHGNITANSGWSVFSPNQDFGGANSAGGQVIEFDVAPWYGNWAFTHLGYDHTITDSDPMELHFDTDTHLSFFVLNDMYQIWDSGTEIVGFGAGVLPTNVGGTAMHHFELVCTDPTDYNPFDGAGQTTIDFYVDDYYITSYTRYDGGYTNNYLGLQGFYDHTEWDNLEITNAVTNLWTGPDTIGGSGNWSVNSNWNMGYYPNAQGAPARFEGVSLYYDSTVTLNSEDITVGVMTFDNVYYKYTIDTSGSYKLILDNGTWDAQISVDNGIHEIQTDMVIKSSVLDISVGKSIDFLSLSGAVTPFSGGFDTVLSGDGGVELVPGGSLTTTSVSGDGQIWLDGGTLNTTDINVGTLGLGMQWGTTGTYSLTGEITVTNLTGGGGTSTFTFSGGTLKGRTYNDLNYVQSLTTCQVSTDSVVDPGLTGEHSNHLVFNQVLTGTGKLTLMPGITSFQLDNPGWSGGIHVEGGTCQAIGDTPQAFGTGPVDVDTDSNVWVILNSSEISIANPITFKGPDIGTAAFVYRGPAAEGTGICHLTGTISLQNDPLMTVGGAPNFATIPGTTLDLNGQITDGATSGGLTFAADPVYFYDPYCNYTISGSTSNNYTGDTIIEQGWVYLQKDAGQIAIPSTSVTLKTVETTGGGTTEDPYPVVSFDCQWAAITWMADEQINPNAVITMNSTTVEEGFWTLLELNGHQQTIAGLETTGSFNMIRNNSDDPALLIVNGGGNYNGPLYDNDTIAGTTGKLTLEKRGAGTTLKLTLDDTFEVGDPPVAVSWTGDALITEGTLEFDNTYTLVGDVTGAGNLTVGDGSNAAVLTLTGTVDVDGTTTVSDASTLVINSAGAALVTVAGAGSLQVNDGATLTSGSITVGTLSIGGTVAAAAMAPVPEPSTWILLAFALLGLASGTWWNRRP